MAGASIDHIISLTILIAALMIAMMSFNQMFSSAVIYETNTQVASKAVDIINTVCLSPGNPADWGATDDDVLGFGLQDPVVGGYALSPYSIMKLNTANSASELVYYDETGLFYNNISTKDGYAILTPLGNCVNYTTAAELLGITGHYGFSLDITPTLNVNVTQVGTNPLRLNVQVYGSGMPLSGATLDYYLFHIIKIDSSDYPIINLEPSGVALTDQSGSAELVFSNVTGNNPVYSFTVYARLSGLCGVGSKIRSNAAADNFVVPLIEDYDQGKIILAHSWDVLDSGDEAAVHYSAAFYGLTSDFMLQQFEIENSIGLLNSGEGKPYITTQIPASEVGILVISYTARGDLGSIIVPWGVGALGVSASYSGGLGSGNSKFVATELRQVTVDGVSYQVKVSVWKYGN
jgi:hypothetical protein